MERVDRILKSFAPQLNHDVRSSCVRVETGRTEGTVHGYGVSREREKIYYKCDGVELSIEGRITTHLGDTDYFEKVLIKKDGNVLYQNDYY